MLMQSSPDIEQLIRRDFAALLAEAVDGVAIDGGGTNEPNGILQTTGIGSVAMGTNGGTITWAAVIDLIAELEIDNAEGSAFLTNPQVVKSARKTAKVASTDSQMVMEAPDELAGFPLVSTNLVPSNLTKGTGTGLSALIFGNFSDLLLGYWSEFDLLVNPYESTAYSKGNVQVRGMVTMDVAVRHPESFAAITDLKTT
ncbi:MAG: phage major capsid protein [Alphaproteobacteria bacterium]|nr:MAG: phage major capsid protein [Alphaproteobacteria bacterium]